MIDSSWLHLGIFLLALATAAGTVVRSVGNKVDDRFDKIEKSFDEKFSAVHLQIDRLRDVGYERHLANTERLSRLEGQLRQLSPFNGQAKQQQL
jgi:hypothetical protein